ncbi:MAG TPA: ester cyclase [Polyangiaceae bacterium]
MIDRLSRLAAVACLGLLAAACGGGDEATPPPQPPPPPTPVAATADTTPAPVATAAPAPKPSLAELEATAGKTILDAMNARDAAKYASVYSDDVQYNVAGMPPTNGKADLVKGTQMFFDQFKDLKFWITRTWTSNDMVVTEWGWTGTDTGGMMGKPATNKAAGSLGVTIAWFTPDGQIKKENRYSDFGTIAAQLGMAGKMKAKPVPTAASSIEAHVAKGTPDEAKLNDWAKTQYAAMDAKKEADWLATMDDNADFWDSAAPTEKPMKGKAEAKKFFGMWTKAFPDAATTIVTSTPVEDFVIVETEMKGTQKGALGPIAASKKPVDLHAVDIYQVKDGKMIHGWGYSNGMELMMQIGAIKGPGDPSRTNGAKPDDKAKPTEKGTKPADAKGTTGKPKP